MKKRHKKGKSGNGPGLILSILLTFCILGTIVYFVARRISSEMSQSAISNLSESLELVRGTIEAILDKEAEFQKLMAQEILVMENPEKFIQSYSGSQTMVKISYIAEGTTKGVSNTGEEFTAEELDFSSGKSVGGLPVSTSYLNDMGTWAYTIKCPVVRNGRETAVLYIEYIYESFDEALPSSFYNRKATLYIMDAKSRRFVLKPKGLKERTLGHLDLNDFYRANLILEPEIQEEVSQCIRTQRDIMFYHTIQQKDSLIYMWAVNEGAVYLVGYVPIEAIQREGDAVNQNIFIVVFVMLVAFVICCILYFLNNRQQMRYRKEQER